MKNTDMFEALNDLPDDMLESAEGHGHRASGGSSKRSWFAEHNGAIAAAVSVVVALGTMAALLLTPWNRSQGTPSVGTDGSNDGLIPGQPSDNGSLYGTPGDETTEEPYTDLSDSSVPIEDIPGDVPYLQLGDHAVVLTLSLYCGDWLDENGAWAGMDAEIDLEGFLKASPTLRMAVGDDLKLTLYEAGYTAGRAELYAQQADGDLAMEWKGDFGGSRWTEWVDGSERMLNNDSVYYLIFSFEQYGDTRDGMTEHWEYLASVKLVVGNAGTEQPVETTPGETDPPVPSEPVPADTSLLTELLTSSDRQNGWWKLPDKRALVTTLIEGQISHVLPTGERISTDTAAPIYAFLEMEDAAVLHCTVDDFTKMTFNLPSDLKEDECTVTYVLYDQTGNIVLFSSDNERDFQVMLAKYFAGRDFDIEQYVLEVAITRTTAGEDGSSTETEYGALTHLIVWQSNGGMRYSLAEGENICISSGSEVSLTVKGVWGGAATTVYTDQLAPSIRLIDTASDWDYKCNVLVPAIEEQRVVRNGNSFSWVVVLPDTLSEGTYGIWADGYGSSTGIKLGELTVSKDMITTYTDTSVSGVDELGGAAFWWELPDGRCIAAAKCYGDSLQFDKDGSLLNGDAIEPLIQLSGMDVIPTLVLSVRATDWPDDWPDDGYLPNMVFHMAEDAGYERRGNYQLLDESGELLDGFDVDINKNRVYYMQVDLVKYGKTIGDVTEQFDLHILLRVVTVA